MSVRHIPHRFPLPVLVSRCVLSLLALALVVACDRREEGVEGDLSPETGLTTPTPQDTPPSDPDSGTGTAAPDDASEERDGTDAGD